MNNLVICYTFFGCMFMNRIKELREDNDLTQVEVSKILSISQQQYSRYESGISEMTYQQLITLANFYKVSIDYLLYCTDERKPYPKSAVSIEEKVVEKKVCC